METTKDITTLAEALTQTIELVSQLMDRVIGLESEVKELKKKDSQNYNVAHK